MGAFTVPSEASGPGCRPRFPAAFTGSIAGAVPSVSAIAAGGVTAAVRRGNAGRLEQAERVTPNATDAKTYLRPRDCHFGCEQCPLGMGGKMKSWYENLPDWRMLLTWLVLSFVAAVAYFLPVARLVDAFIE
jgi:hypothetical protein